MRKSILAYPTAWWPAVAVNEMVGDIRQKAFVAAATGADQEAITAEVERRGSLGVVYRSVLYGGLSYENLKD